jgi:hypothetical protein
MPYKDPVVRKEKRRQYMRSWYGENKAAQLERVKARKAKTKAWFNEWKKTLKCSRCPEKDPDCLDFHHRDEAEKDRSISKMAGFSKEAILAEAKKCDVLCSNCHRKHHAQKRQVVNGPLTPVFVKTIAPMAPRHEDAIVAPIADAAEPSIT